MSTSRASNSDFNEQLYMNSNNKTEYEIQSVPWSPMWGTIGMIIVSLAVAAIIVRISILPTKIFTFRGELVSIALLAIMIHALLYLFFMKKYKIVIENDFVFFFYKSKLLYQSRMDDLIWIKASDIDKYNAGQLKFRFKDKSVNFNLPIVKINIFRFKYKPDTTNYNAILCDFISNHGFEKENRSSMISLYHNSYRKK